MKRTRALALLLPLLLVPAAQGCDSDGPADPGDPLEARRLVPRPRLLGVSAGTVREAISAERAGADYLGAGPVFATATKADAGEPIGLGGLAAIASAVGIPVVGIGGIDSGNASSVIEAGAAGVAVISAVIGAGDPEAAAREILSKVREALGRKGASGPAERGEEGT